ncbi:protein kinase domain-containing protein [Acaryochloris thomasi]|uniref:serine/threonine-protein kinase n=1 Tax=Acaryochloris thomasi TaxID=2929456 RepID=UPI00131497FC|nr:serine/threonine-protein kinase [Acaryochloris thomasi]
MSDDLSKPDCKKVLKAVWEISRFGTFKNIELLQRESRVLPILAHPGIPKAEFDNYFEVVTPQGDTLHCMVMEYVEGQTLLDWLREHQPISDEVALNWLQQLAQILHILHSIGVIHRDLKPDNILLKATGELVLIDYGAIREITNTYLSKLSIDLSEMGTDSTDFEITRIYTHGYAPPEQIKGRAIASSDFFALGRTIVHMVTGIHPMYLPEEDETAKLIWRDKAPQISQTLADYIDKLLERNPRKRPTNTEDLIHDLTQSVPKARERHRYFGSKWARLLIVILAIVSAGTGVRIGQLKWSEALVKEGERYLKEFRYESAQNKFDLAIKINPDNHLAYNFIATTCFQSQDFACARENYQKSFEKGPPESRWLNYANIGRVYDEGSKFSEARQYYELSIKESKGKEAYPINNLARLDLLEGKAPDARKRLMPLMEQQIDPLEMSSVFKNMGWAELQLKNFEAAQIYLENSISIQSELLERYRKRVVSPADAHCLLLKVQKKLNNFDKETYRACLLFDSDTPEGVEWKLEYIDQLNAKIDSDILPSAKIAILAT